MNWLEVALYVVCALMLVASVGAAVTVFWALWSQAGRPAPWSDKRLVGYTPVLTALLLEGANVQQIFRMWREHSALGQSPWGWLQVNLALWLWLNFYRVVTPEAKWAIRATALGVFLNGCVLASVLYWGSR